MPINDIRDKGVQSMQKQKQQTQGKQPIQSKITQFLTDRAINKPKEITDSPQKKEPACNRPSPSPVSRHSRSPHSHTQSLSSSLSAITPINKSPPAKQQQRQPDKSLNVGFYLNKQPSRPNGVYISTIHAEWKNDYQRLQRDHSFIQWLFPNSFQSRFNPHATPLSLEQAQTFRNNMEMLQRYVFSYSMILGFFGIRLRSKVTGELGRSRQPDYKQRFHKTLLTSFHNHMRATRILCSLSQLGFGGYATELCGFLKHEIYAPDGALTALQRYNVYEQWKAFENAAKEQQVTNVYMLKVTKGHIKEPYVASKEEKHEENMKKRKDELEKRQCKG